MCFLVLLTMLCIESFALCCISPTICPSGVKISSTLIYCIAVVTDINNGSITVEHEAGLSLESEAGDAGVNSKPLGAIETQGCFADCWMQRAALITST